MFYVVVFFYYSIIILCFSFVLYCFSVVLALDKDLNSLAPEADNRLSDDKENAIKQILSAKVMSTEMRFLKLKPE